MMKQDDLEKLILLLSRDKSNNFYDPLSLILKNGVTHLHYLGILETARIIEILNDRISLQTLNLQNHNSLGLKETLNELVSENDEKIIQVEIITLDCSYKLLFTTKIDRLIGCYKNIKKNIEKDFEYQKNLISIGHPNRNILLVNNGKIVGDMFQLGLL